MDKFVTPALHGYLSNEQAVAKQRGQGREESSELRQMKRTLQRGGSSILEELKNVHVTEMHVEDGRRGDAAGGKVREFQLYKGSGKPLKGFSQRSNSVSFA